MGVEPRALLFAIGGAAVVLAHGHVNNIVVNGVLYPGYDVTKLPYMSNPPVVVGWSATNTDNGFVEPNKFGTPDIICHRAGGNAKGYAKVRAGDKILLQWDTWPDSHKGPVLDYLAKCPSNDCSTVDKTSLRFFKIGEGSRISGSGAGYWAADVLIENNFSWVVQIPADIAPGHYVLRHEIIALHGSPNRNGAQAYPQCFNLEISGSGTVSPRGIPGTSLYTANDPGILFQLYTNPNYPVPGPALIPGVPSTVAQVSTAATATSSPFLYGGGNSPQPTTTRTGGNMPTPTLTPTARPPTSTPASGGQTRYGQCGGSGWTGPTACAPGQGVCSTINPYYHQCV